MFLTAAHTSLRLQSAHVENQRTEDTVRILNTMGDVSAPPPNQVVSQFGLGRPGRGGRQRPKRPRLNFRVPDFTSSAVFTLVARGRFLDVGVNI